MSSEERKELVPEERPKEVEKATVYDDFVEGVASREVAEGHGVAPDRMGRIFKQVDEGKGEVIHVAGEKDVVSDIGNTLQRGGYTVEEWHITRPEDKKEEVERIKPDLQELVAHSPLEGIDALLEGARQRLGAPSTFVDRTAGKLAGRTKGDDFAEGVEAGLGLDKALEGFEPKFEKQEEEKGGK